MTPSDAFVSTMFGLLLIALIVGHIVRHWPKKDKLQEGDLWQ